MRKLLTLLLILNIHLLSYGVYLENVPYQLTQPNGEVLNVFITGDEFYRRVHDSNGYSIVPGNDGWYYYAMYDAVLDDLIPSEFVVTATQRTDLPCDGDRDHIVANAQYVVRNTDILSSHNYRDRLAIISLSIVVRGFFACCDNFYSALLQI